MQSAPSTTSGRYRFISKLASGGMAEVYRAVLSGPEGFEKPAVVKCMLPELARQDHYRQMFIEEARLMSSLSHRNVVAVLDFGRQPDGGYFIALEYVDGVDLGRALRACRRLSPNLAIHLTDCVLRGLAYVHSRREADGKPLGIIHRDVSPQNVLLGRDGDVKLGDFGIAKGLATVRHTEPGTIRGKVQYMSPEQARAAPLDCRSDLYSVGVMLYEVLLGRKPFDAKSDLEILLAVSQARFPPPLSVDPTLDPALAALLSKALSLDPAERFASAEEMAQALLACVQGKPAGAQEVGELVGKALGAPAAAPVALASTARADSLFGAELRQSQGEEVASRIESTAVERRLGSGSRPEQTQTTAASPRRGRAWLGGSVVGALALAGALATAHRVREPTMAAPTPSAVVTAPPAAPSLLLSPPPPEASPESPAGPSEAAQPIPPPQLEPPPLELVPLTNATRPPRKASRPSGSAKSALAPATIDINSTPWAKVTIDGVERGQTPVRSLSLAPGRHVLHLNNPLSGQRATLTVHLKPGEVRIIPVNLEAPGQAP